MSDKREERPRAISPKNLSAQLDYEAVGNPPSAHPRSAISNAYPGLEMDFRNVWKKLFVGIELHESSNVVVAADADAPQELRDLVLKFVLQSVDGRRVYAPVTGPLVEGEAPVPLPDTTYSPGRPSLALEWSNALADAVGKGGEQVLCGFRPFEQRGVETVPETMILLTVRRFFEQGLSPSGETEQLPVIARDIAEPGQLSQSLCSPWQNDYRECACFYWAASRPDYVNIEARADGTSGGQNWMQKDRTAATPKVYIVDDWVDSRLYTHEDLFAGWEKLRFIIGGRDESEKK